MTAAPRRSVPLGELEAAVMNHLWAGGSGEAKSVHLVVGNRRGITLNTIQSTLKRLYEKGLLARDKVSHAHVYRPVQTRDEYHRGLIRELAGALAQGPDGLVAAFVDIAERAGTEHLERLEALVAARRKELEKGAK